MKERPILFSASMVRALLDGSKTQTRRTITVPHRGAFALRDDGSGWWPYQSDDGESVLCNDGNEYPMSCPHGAPGDRLWARETWRLWESGSWCGSEPLDPDVVTGSLTAYDPEWLKTRPLEYRADGGDSDGPWRPGIFMPRWASRITLEVTDVRVQRLQEIDELDSLAEGIPEVPRCGCDVCRMTSGMCTADAGEQVRQYADLWDHINGKRPGCRWDDNPWVWAITFKRVKP